MTAAETESFLLALLVRFAQSSGAEQATRRLTTLRVAASHRWMMVAMAMGL
jgi:hypothetical protein